MAKPVFLPVLCGSQSDVDISENNNAAIAAKNCYTKFYLLATVSLRGSSRQFAILVWCQYVMIHDVCEGMLPFPLRSLGFLSTIFICFSSVALLAILLVVSFAALCVHTTLRESKLPSHCNIATMKSLARRVLFCIVMGLSLLRSENQSLTCLWWKERTGTVGSRLAPQFVLSLRCG